MQSKMLVSPGLNSWDSFCGARYGQFVERVGKLYIQFIKERRKSSEAQYVEYNKMNGRSRGSGTERVTSLSAVVQKKKAEAAQCRSSCGGSSSVTKTVVKVASSSTSGRRIESAKVTNKEGSQQRQGQTQ